MTDLGVEIAVDCDIDLISLVREDDDDDVSNEEDKDEDDKEAYCVVGKVGSARVGRA